MQQKIIKLFALTVAVLCVSPLQAQKAIGLFACYTITELLPSPSS